MTYRDPTIKWKELNQSTTKDPTERTAKNKKQCPAGDEKATLLQQDDIGNTYKIHSTFQQYSIQMENLVDRRTQNAIDNLTTINQVKFLSKAT